MINGEVTAALTIDFSRIYSNDLRPSYTVYNTSEGNGYKWRLFACLNTCIVLEIWMHLNTRNVIQFGADTKIYGKRSQKFKEIKKAVKDVVINGS